jgi:hypothetical protein
VRSRRTSNSVSRSDGRHVRLKWQVKYALANIAEHSQLAASHIDGELIRIIAQNRPDVFAAISAENELNGAAAKIYKDCYPNIDFLCGYRSSCIWHGEAIDFLENSNIGWGGSGTLISATLEGNANSASHKTYKFADRLLRQQQYLHRAVREFDRVHRVTLRSGSRLRIGMLTDYEPTADAVRGLWDQFGKLDIIWNINPNGNPTVEAIKAGRELGCEVVKWERLKEILQTTL